MTAAFEPYIDYTFEWRQPVKHSVFVSGSYDSWVTRTPLSRVERDGASVFEVRKRLPARDFQYKFIVDDTWLVDETKPLATDADGNQNNVLHGGFILGATVARELHRRIFVCAERAPCNGATNEETKPASADGSSPRDYTYLTFHRYPGQCEAQYPWHGEWQLAEHTPDNVVQSGVWSVSLRRTQRVLQFEPALSCCGCTSATYDISALCITTSGPRTMSFTRNIT